MDKKPIPILDLGPEIEAIWDELMGAVAGVLKSGQFIMGPNVKAFECEVAEYFGVKHAVGVNSGTDALLIALRTAGVGKGDEVITTPFTFFATAEVVSMLEAVPVFVDIDPVTFNMRPDLVERAITSRTKAILPVHLFGQGAEMDPIMSLAKEHGLRVIEDVAQAFGGEYKGKKLGTIGHAGCFSFFPSKTLGGFGDGGLMTTDDDRMAEMARMLRAHGSRRKYYNEVVGYNSRLDELQAAMLRVKLQLIDQMNEGRREVARRYGEMLKGLSAVTPPREVTGGKHVYHQYTIRVAGGERDQVKAALAAEGINTMIYYPLPVHRLPVYDGQFPAMPETERASGEVLSLPIWPSMDEGLQGRVVEALTRSLLS